MQVLWCIAEGVHSPQFKASHVVSKAFFGDAGDTVLWSCWGKISNSFPVCQAGTSADIFYTNLEARPRPFVLLPLLMH